MTTAISIGNIDTVKVKASNNGFITISQTDITEGRLDVIAFKADRALEIAEAILLVSKSVNG